MVDGTFVAVVTVLGAITFEGAAATVIYYRFGAVSVSTDVAKLGKAVPTGAAGAETVGREAGTI